MRHVRVGKRLVAKVDDEDYPAVAAHKWRPVTPRNVTYACSTLTTGRRQATLYMHRLVLERMGRTGEKSDHINGDGLDNRRANLRPATAGENRVNTDRVTGASRFKGVTPVGRRWAAYIHVAGRQHWLGTFDTEQQAADARAAAAKVTWGAFAERR